jgi:dTDP-glucose 4,6-dehydratase
MFFIPQEELNHAIHGLSCHDEVFKNKTFLITGGTGFIGKWLVATLHQLNSQNNFNIKIYILTRNKKLFVDRFRECLPKENIYFIEADIKSLNNLENFDIDFDYIVLGANDATYDFSLNSENLSKTLIGGTFNLFKAFVTPKTKSIIHLSSGAVYGDISKYKNGARETDHSLIDINKIGSMYGLSKALVESILNQFGDQNNIDIINARCFAFVGPYLPLDKHFAIGNFINDCINSRPILVNGDGSPIRSYMYASDMARAILFCLVQKKSMAINIGSDKQISIEGLAKLVSKTLKNNDVIIKDKGSIHPEKANYYLPDITLLKSLGYKESYLLEESIKRTFSFYN